MPTQRPPDSRATAGQAIEDRLDATTDEMRRRTRDWIAKSRRGDPRDAKLHAAIIGGIAAGLLDELFEQAAGEPELALAAWTGYGESYAAALEADAQADAEPTP